MGESFGTVKELTIFISFVLLNFSCICAAFADEEQLAY
jgi:hypothetical protein